MRIYISGLVSNGDQSPAIGDIETQNRADAFEFMAEKLTALGHVPYNPVQELADGRYHPWEWYIRRALLTLSLEEDYIGAIMMLKGWQESKGACFERLVAQTLGLIVFYSIEEVPNKFDLFLLLRGAN